MQSLLLLCLLALLSICELTQAQLLVNTTLGWVNGLTINATLHSSIQLRSWYNIPYAASPTSSLRWKKPQSRTPWTSTFQATQQNVVIGCPQNQYLVDARLVQTEDCLIVNVVAPVLNSTTTLLPVMVWIHGGSLRNGAGGLFDGSTLVAEQNVIYVSINYRLGVLGFMGLKALASETGGIVGNYGFFDQMMALQWVQSNIANFGGDANLVTIFGESAGALSVAAHLASPQMAAASPPLFHRAILESVYLPGSYWSVSDSDWYGRQFVYGTSCKGLATDTLTIACMRGLSVTALLAITAANNLASFAITVDPTNSLNFANDTLINNIVAGTWNKVPILMGSNHDEYALWLCGTYGSAYANLTLANFEAYLTFLVGSNSTLIGSMLTEYPYTSYSSPQVWHMAVDIITDAVFTCSSRNVATAAAFADASNAFRNNVYVYRLAYAGSWTTACYQVAHGVGDVPLIFPKEGQWPFSLSILTSTDLAMGQQMRAVWAKFALTGNASLTDSTVVSGGLTFPSFNTNSVKTTFELTGPGTTGGNAVSLFKEPQCAYWNSLPSNAMSSVNSNYQVRVTGITGTNCAGTAIFSVSTRNGTCAAVNVPVSSTLTLTFYFIPLCAADSNRANWTVTLYADAACSIALPVSKLSASASTVCGYTDISALKTVISQVSAIVDCSNQPPVLGTLAVYDGIYDPYCGATHPNTLAYPSYKQFLSGACFQLSSTSYGSIQCFGTSSTSAFQFNLYTSSNSQYATCGGSPYKTYGGSGNTDCVPIVNLQFDCGTGGTVPTNVATRNVTTTVTPTPPTSSDQYVILTFATTVTNSTTLRDMIFGAVNTAFLLSSSSYNSMSLLAGPDSSSVMLLIKSTIVWTTISGEPSVTAEYIQLQLLTSSSKVRSLLPSVISASSATPTTASPALQDSMASSTYYALPLGLVGGLVGACVSFTLLYAWCTHTKDKSTGTRV